MRQMPFFSMYRPHAYAADTNLRFSCMSSRRAFFLSTYLMHIQQIRLQTGNFLSTTLSHALPTSPKTPVNDVDNYVLLLRCHLVIAWQTEPAPENIRSYVHSRALYVSICTASAIALDCDEGIGPIYRLHMHGLPYWTTFCTESSYCICTLYYKTKLLVKSVLISTFQRILRSL
jgi:hypothetical protein